MNRIGMLVVAALLLGSTAVSAHDVPDRVTIGALVKVERDHLVILVRVPANALIDFLFPTLTEGNWLDLPNATPMAAEAARVWIADRLSLFEDGRGLPAPKLLAVRLARVNDPSFRTFADALSRVRGVPLPADTLVTQDQVTVDALLQIPIHSADSSFSFEPRFARLGVVVDTTLTFLPPDGSVRSFQYQGDPETFELAPARGQVIARFLKAGAAHYAGETDYLLLALCVALLVQRFSGALPFAAALAGAEGVIVLACLALFPAGPWMRGIVGVLIAATTVYVGAEAIIAADTRRIGVAGVAGLTMGGSFWLGLQPLVQFGGTHPLAADLAFTIGVLAAQLLTIALLIAAAWITRQWTRAPRAIMTIAAAIAIHVAWRRMLDRADALALMPLAAPVNLAMLATIAAAALALLAASAYYRGVSAGRMRVEV